MHHGRCIMKPTVLVDACIMDACIITDDACIVVDACIMVDDACIMVDACIMAGALVYAQDTACMHYGTEMHKTKRKESKVILFNSKSL